ncbi:MAG: (d)CMP kinase [Bacteroidota bacterium]|nr:(d)CMP kinase [Bacteroidota bacterium]HHU96997.1 (d)CMP kinase [Petrimonas sp.]
MKKINIAIDGFSSCGKSTMAKGLAKELGYTYIDTGAMYRAAALYAIRNGWMTEETMEEETIRESMGQLDISFRKDSKGNQNTYLNGEDVESEIRSLEVSNGASRISTLPFVRSTLVSLQQKMAEKGGVVMDGRDIGTVVMPDAELKIFLTASPEVRANRRFKEMLDKGENPKFEDVLHNVMERDQRDTMREASPLRKADDAIELDNSHMGIKEQFEWALEQAKKIKSV